MQVASLRVLAVQSFEKLGRSCTFADTLHCAHLIAIFHGVQAEVNFRQRLLLLDGANGLVHVLRLVDILRVVLHGRRVCRKPEVVGQERWFAGGRETAVGARGEWRRR